MEVQLTQLGCDISRVKMTSRTANPFSDFVIFLRFLRLMIMLRPDVFLGFTVKPFVYGSLAAQIIGAKTVGTITGLGTAFIRKNWVTRVVKVLYRLATYKMKTVVFQNQSDLDMFVLQKLVSRCKTVLIPGSGLDLYHYSQRPIKRTRSQDAPVFLYIGRVLWDKGIGEFVESARKLKETHPGAQCQIAGKVDVDNVTAIGKSQVIKWENEGVIKYLGFHHDPRGFIEDADCVVLPSYREGLPRSLLEGAAMGRPLLASDCPGCTDVVMDGVNGFVFRKKSAESLLSAMRRFIKLSFSERQQIGAAGRKIVEDRFDQSLVHEAYLKVTTG